MWSPYEKILKLYKSTLVQAMPALHNVSKLQWNARALLKQWIHRKDYNPDKIANVDKHVSIGSKYPLRSIPQKKVSAKVQVAKS